MRKKLLITATLGTFCVMAAFASCGSKQESTALDGMTFDIAASETVEIGEAYWLCEKKAVSADGKLYKPEVKVYREGEDITEAEVKAEVFFVVDSFVDYRVEYIVQVGDEKKVFSTDISVVDTTKPTMLPKDLSETMELDSTFVLNKNMFEVTDNSGETLSPTFSVWQINGSRKVPLEENGNGEYALQSGHISALEVNVTATDSHDNAMDETFIIKNSQAEFIKFTQIGSWNTFWSSVNEAEYFYSKETVNGSETEVVTLNTDVSNVANGKALPFVVKFGETTYDLPGTLEFDIYTENMCNWFSIMPYDGAQKGTEIGVKDYGNEAWYHCKVELTDTIASMNSLIFHLQPTTKQWWGEKLNVYDAGKLTTLKLANIKYTEKAPIEIPDEIPEDTLVDCNGEYAITCVQTKDQEQGAMNGSHTISWTDEIKYEGEKGSLKLTATNGKNGYFILSNPLFTNVSGYDYVEFQVYNPNTTDMRISTVWKDAFVIPAGDWGTVKLYVADLNAGSIVEPFSGAAISATDITSVGFYVREIAAGNSIYISSIKAVKGADLCNIDCGKDTYMGVVEGATAETFAQYGETLINADYEKISERTANNNVFATFINAEEYRYVYYTPYNNQMRVVTGPIETLLREDYSTTATETVTPFIASIPQPSEGEGFIFRLPDGRFIIQDGGWQGEDRVYQTFKKLVGDSKIVIAAWFISHPHEDHYPAFLNFLEDHGKDENITIERVVYNYGRADMYNISDSGNPAGSNVPDQVNRLYNAMATYAPNVPFLKAHTGQLLNFGSATVEILYTIEDLIPNVLPNINDSSMAIRLTLADNTIVLLNDTSYASGPILHNLWGNYLKSDIVQVAHHGTWPSVPSIYHDIAAETLLYPGMREFLQSHFVDTRFPEAYEAFLTYAKDMYVCGDEMVVINLPYVLQNNIEAETQAVLNPPKKEYTTPSMIPENTLVDMNANYALNSITAKMLNGRYRATYSTEVKYGNELGSVKLTCSRDGDGYFVLSNTLIKDISKYDYIEFQVYNPSASDIYIAVAWVKGVTIPAGEWGTVRVDVASYLDNAITDPWTGATISATDITGTAFYIKNAVVGDVVYISSIKAVKEAE